MKHLAIFTKGSTDNIFRCKKTIDIRLSKRAIAPYQKIKRGDIILIKESGELVLGEARAENVLFFNNLNQEKLDSLKNRYQESSRTSNQFWERHRSARFCSIIFLTNVKRYLSPVSVDKRDRSGWKIF